MTDAIRRHPVEVVVPEDALVTAELAVVLYIDADGHSRYSVRASGDMPMTSFLGMTLLAQDQIKEWGRE